jgi:hypothetical protein
MTISRQIDLLTDHIDQIWADVPERDPELLSVQKQRVKKKLVAQKLMLCRHRWKSIPALYRRAREGEVTCLLLGIAVDEAIKAAKE